MTDDVNRIGKGGLKVLFFIILMAVIIGQDILLWGDRGIVLRFYPYIRILVPLIVILYILTLMGSGVLSGEFLVSTKGRALPYAWNRIAKSLKEGFLNKIPIINKVSLRNIGYTDYLRQALLDNNILIYGLTNYCLRVDIYHAKNYYFARTMDKVDGYFKLMAQHTDLIKVKQDLVRYRSNIPKNMEKDTVGWSYYNKLVIDDLNRLYEIITVVLLEIELATNNIVKPEEKTWNVYEAEILNTIKRVGALEGKRSASMTAYNSRKKAYVAHMGARSRLLQLFDMYNLSGNLEHSFLFAKKGANYKNGSQGQINTDPNASIPTYEEVDIFGRFMEDLNKLKAKDIYGERGAEIYNQNPPRKLVLPFGNIIHSNNIGLYRQWMGPDWLFYNQDFRDGRYHPYSRTVNDYIRAHEGKDPYAKITYKDNEILKIHADPNEGDPAFDKRAYANIGEAPRYWGRKNFTDIEEMQLKGTEFEGNPFLNPWPAVTTLGMTKYLNEIIRLTEFNRKVAEQMIAGYPADIGGNVDEMEKVIRRMSERKEESK